jgi:uncharacterized protein YndB with AHSA1/START domain
MALEELTITHIFNASLDVVWRAWTDPEIFKRWWGPKEFTTPIVKIDLKVGGKHFNCMQAPDGENFCSIGTYQEIKPEEKLVVTDSFADENGQIVPSTYYGLGEGFPMEMLLKIYFQEKEGKTELTLRHSNIENISESDLNDMRQGWIESLEKLDEYLQENC